MTSQLNQALLEYTTVYLNFEDIQSIDLSVESALEGILKSLPQKNLIHITIGEGDTEKMFRKLGLYKYMDEQNIHIIPSGP